MRNLCVCILHKSREWIIKNSENVVSGITISRKNLAELIIVAVLLSFGINVIAGQFLIWLKDQSIIALLVGTPLCIIPIFYALISLFGKRKKRVSVQGVCTAPIRLDTNFVILSE